MPDLASSMVEPTGGFEIKDKMMRYSLFIPRLYNWCRSLGFERGKIMPSRAFCSDESQGYPIIMIAKHFGTFPFNHGRVGGIVATDRHGPHADHGQDLVIIQASHVGYDPDSNTFGIYRRLQTANEECGPSCGKIQNIIDWYRDEYLFAQQNILLHKIEGKPSVIVDNQLLREDRNEGLILRLERLIETNSHGQHIPLKTLSTSKAYPASTRLIQTVGESSFDSLTPTPVDDKLTSEMFYYRRNLPKLEEGAHNLEPNLIRYMPQIVTSPSPNLIAAQINTQVEFDSTFRTIVKHKSFQGKRVLFVSGLNIDISPQSGQLFPLTKFVPWAAYIQEPAGNFTTLEQDELYSTLESQSTENPDQINLEDAIHIMADAKEIKMNL